MEFSVSTFAHTPDMSELASSPQQATRAAALTAVVSAPWGGDTGQITGSFYEGVGRSAWEGNLPSGAQALRDSTVGKCQWVGGTSPCLRFLGNDYTLAWQPKQLGDATP